MHQPKYLYNYYFMNIIQGETLNQKQTSLQQLFKQLENKPNFQKLLTLQKVLLTKGNEYFLGKYRQRYVKTARAHLGMISLKRQLKQQIQQMTQIQYQRETKMIVNGGIIDYQIEFEQFQYAKFLQKLRRQVRFQNQKGYSSIQLFKQKNNLFVQNYPLPDDTCVGCNAFFYKYHTFQPVINEQLIPVKFLYHYVPEGQQSKSFSCDSSICSDQGFEPPSLISRVNIYKIEESKKNILREMVGLLNEKGGFIMIGCKNLANFQNFKAIKKNWKLNLYRRIEFVMGHSINQQTRMKIVDEIKTIIQHISPRIQMETNIQIKFIPVQQCPFKLGFDLDQDFIDAGQWKQMNNYVILLKIIPTEYATYIKDYDIEQDQQLQQYSLSSQDTHQKYKTYLMNEMTSKKKEQEQWMIINQRNIFEDHVCHPNTYELP